MPIFIGILLAIIGFGLLFVIAHLNDKLDGPDPW